MEEHSDGSEDEVTTNWAEDLTHGAWERIGFDIQDVQVVCNNVDNISLETLKEEAKVIAARVKHALGLRTNASVASVPVEKIYSLF